MNPIPVRLTSPAFWKTGVVVGVSLAVLIGYQFSDWVTRSDDAAALARSATQLQYPSQAWALEKWDRCRRGIDEFAGQKRLFLFECDTAVKAETAGQGALKAAMVSDALDDQNASQALARAQVKPDWPLSAVYPALDRLVMAVITL
ncbi:hypothetical protein ACYPKM_04970 [Pseudomonas aeruginosa]